MRKPWFVLLGLASCTTPKTAPAPPQPAPALSQQGQGSPPPPGAPGGPPGQWPLQPLYQPPPPPPPIARGAFTLTIHPDAEVQAAHRVKVHVFSARDLAAAAVGNVDAYWLAPPPSRKMLAFGQAGGSGAQTLAAPFSTGDAYVVLVADLPASGNTGAGDTRTRVIKLEYDMRDPLNPVAHEISVGLGRSGWQ